MFAVLLGIVAGLRVFTWPAVAALFTGSGAPKYLLPLVALGEYVADASPKIPPRTAIFPSVIFRSLSGGLAGWFVEMRMGGPLVIAVMLGVIGALLGTCGGYNLRMRLISSFGSIPAAIAEDVLAILLATFVVFQVAPTP